MMKADGKTGVPTGIRGRPFFRLRDNADLPKDLAEKMALTQRPVTREAVSAPSGERPLWRELPSWFVFCG